MIYDACLAGPYLLWNSSEKKWTINQSKIKDKIAMKYLIFVSIIFLVSCSKANTNYILNDKNNSKYYLLNIIKQAQKENKLGKKPMLIIDSKPIYYHYKKEIEIINIKKDDIKSFKIIDAPKCVSIYGAACKYGLIEVKTY